MSNFTTPKISKFMEDVQSISPEKYETVKQIRDIYFNYNPDIAEDIKYGGLVFLKGSELISGIFVYKNHISIEFGEGATFSDPHSVLEGKGQFRRHIKIRSTDDITTKNVVDYVQQALAKSRN